jgi:hypothetical protein
LFFSSHFFFFFSLSLSLFLFQLLGDVNIVVVSKAIKCLTLLARGLRSEFTYWKQCVATLLEKFKEKKQNIIEGIHETLDICFQYCFTLADIMEGTKKKRKERRGMMK